MTSHTSPGPSRDEVQAHRGASAIAPENTIAAFRAAAEAGAKWVELDVALSADGTLVVIHDDTVDRTSSGKGSLGELSAAQIGALDGGSWFDPRFAGERIPTLAQTIAALGELGLSANVEIKQHPHHQSLDQLVRAVQADIGQRSAGTRIMISSFDPEALKAMHALEPDLEMAMLWEVPPTDWVEQPLLQGPQHRPPRGDDAARHQGAGMDLQRSGATGFFLGSGPDWRHHRRSQGLPRIVGSPWGRTCCRAGNATSWP
jgi:glycerophosphoryl diester phosphodiesterase